MNDNKSEKEMNSQISSADDNNMDEDEEADMVADEIDGGLPPQVIDQIKEQEAEQSAYNGMSVADEVASQSASQSESSSATDDSASSSESQSSSESNDSESDASNMASNADMADMYSSNAQSEMREAFDHGGPTMDDPGDNNTSENANEAKKAMDSFAKEADESGHISNKQIRDMQSFCDNMIRVVCGSRDNYNEDMTQLQKQAYALANESKVIGKGEDAKDLAGVKTWIKTGGPQALVKYTHKFAVLAKSPEVHALWNKMKADAKKDPSTMKFKKPIRNKTTVKQNAHRAFTQLGSQYGDVKHDMKDFTHHDYSKDSKEEDDK